jgi:hypothetical protein
LYDEILFPFVSGDAALSINGRPIKIGKQTALCLGQMQGDGFGLTTGAEKQRTVFGPSA